MSRYIVKVTYTYPCDATNAEDALQTINVLTKVRFGDLLVKGEAQIFNANGIRVMTAELKQHVSQENKPNLN